MRLCLIAAAAIRGPRPVAEGGARALAGSTLGAFVFGAALAGGAPVLAQQVGAAANAQSVMHSEVSGYVIRKGEVSVTDLAASEANRQALQQLPRNVPAIEQPKHRLPNGGLTSKPSPEMLRALPHLDKTNVDVAAGATAGANQPLFKSLTGFVGIYEGDNVTANGYELEPPDQGLAVYSNQAAEINNNIVQFYTASTGAALTGPIANSAFFGTGSAYSLTDPQVFYDHGSKRWFFVEVISSSSFDGFAVAVSETSNPLGSYWIYYVRAFSNTVSGKASPGVPGRVT
jgi:hypothetical protein